MITISYFWMNAHVVALASPPNVVLLGGVTWTLEPDHSHGEEGPHGVERHGHRYHAEQVKVVTDPEERSSRLPPKGLASSWIAANEKVKNKRKILTLFYKPFQARHRLQVVGWVSGWCQCQDCPPSSSPRSRRTSRTTSASCAADGGTGCTESHSLHRRRSSGESVRMSSTNGKVIS